MNVTEAEILVRMPAVQNATHVFGISGGAVIPLYDALHDAPFVHLLMRHEQAAVHAAEGYARVSGMSGVCICTSGPGFTNSVTGLATAFADSIPLVLVCGQVAMSLIGADAFQERRVALIRCDLPVKDAALLHRLLDRTSLRVLEEGAGTMLLEASGDRETVDACVEAMSAFGVRDVLTGGPFIMGLSSGEGETN